VKGALSIEKRDKIGVIVWLCIMLVFTVGIEIRERWRFFLFPDLQQEDVLSIDMVYCAYPPYSLSKEDQTTLVECLKQLKVYVSVSPCGVIEVCDGCPFWTGEIHMKDGSNVTIVTAPYSTVTFNGTDYNCDDTALKQQIFDIFAYYISVIRSTSKPVLEKQ